MSDLDRTDPDDDDYEDKVLSHLFHEARLAAEGEVPQLWAEANE